MKKNIDPELKKNRVNTIASLLEYLHRNGMPPNSAEMFINLNMPPLGDFRTLRQCANEGSWDEVWTFIDRYFDGIYF